MNTSRCSLSSPTYGVGAFIALALAWKRVFHPILPYAYTTFDVILVSLNILFLTNMLGFSPHMAFAIPASALIFLVLAHAAMRFRPELVMYAGAMTIMLMALGIAVMPAPEQTAPSAWETEHSDLVESVLHSRTLPFAIIGLATLALWATSRRTFLRNKVGMISARCSSWLDNHGNTGHPWETGHSATSMMRRPFARALPYQRASGLSG